MSHWLQVSLMTFLFLQDYTQSLRLVEVRIPKYVIKGSSAQLECLYDLDGETLYSVKWYKDGNEFYRYVPRDMPPAQTFLLPGVKVELHNSSAATVTLKDVDLMTAGRFRCEVSGEAPSFQTVTEHGDMVVVSLPDQGPPKITGGRPRYQIGDWVRINCTVGRAKPAVQLAWYVNGELAEPHTLRKYENIISGRDMLETSILGLQFRVEQHHFRNGDMKLKCVASLSTLYWRSNEESVEGDRPQKAPVLESRETVYASNSRADPVQANKTDSFVVAHAPSLLMLLIAAAIASGCLERLLTMSLLCDACMKCMPKRKHQQHQRPEQQQQQQEQELQQQAYVNENQKNDNQENQSGKWLQSRQQRRQTTTTTVALLQQQQQQQQQEQLHTHEMVESERICKANDIRAYFSLNEEMSSVLSATTKTVATTKTPAATRITARAAAPVVHSTAKVFAVVSQRPTQTLLAAR